MFPSQRDRLAQRDWFAQRGRLALCAVAALWIVPAAPAAASVMSGSDTITACATAGGTEAGCTDTVSYSTAPAGETTDFIGGDVAGVDPGLSGFETAFDNWDAANGDGWTLVDGGALDLSITLTLGIGVGSTDAGIDPVIATISGYTPSAGDPSLDQLVWVQGLFTDYTPTAGLVSSPVVTLDTYSLSAGSAGSGGAFQTTCTAIPGQSPGADNTTPAAIGPTPTNTAYCDPIYPFQYGSEYDGDTLDGVTLSTDFFYDAPAGPWPDAAFRAITLLATVTFETDGTGAITGRVLTVYQGFSYGYSLSVPEPGSAWLIGPLLPVLLSMRHRRRTRRTGAPLAA